MMIEIRSVFASVMEGSTEKEDRDLFSNKMFSTVIVV